MKTTLQLGEKEILFQEVPIGKMIRKRNGTAWYKKVDSTVARIDRGDRLGSAYTFHRTEIVVINSPVEEVDLSEQTTLDYFKAHQCRAARIGKIGKRFHANQGRPDWEKPPVGEWVVCAVELRFGRYCVIGVTTSTPLYEAMSLVGFGGIQYEGMGTENWSKHTCALLRRDGETVPAKPVRVRFWVES